MLREEDYFCVTEKKPYREKKKPISSLSRRMKGLNFSGRRILITGASSGLGAELAVSLSRLGADLGLVGRSKKRLEAVAKKCTGGGVIILKANLTKNNQIHPMVSSFIAEYGGMDILINCAAIYSYGTIETTTMKQFDTVMNINIRALYHVTMRSAPELIRSKGCIINVGDIKGLRAVPNSIAYNMSKAAVIHFTRCLAVELGRKGVRCVTVSPSFIETQFSRNYGLRCGQYITLMRNMKKSHALRRIAKVMEIVNIIIYVASGNANFITGCNWLVDGGYNLMPINEYNIGHYFVPLY